MAKKRWTDLSPRTRRIIVIVGSVEAALKVAALVDLASRPATRVRGSRARWAAAIVLVNSAGLVPISYFVRGRQPA